MTHTFLDVHRELKASQPTSSPFHQIKTAVFSSATETCLMLHVLDSECEERVKIHAKVVK